jgi:hypothetical protein
VSVNGKVKFFNETKGLLSLGSCNSGNSAPANGGAGAAFAGECWINTTSNPWVFSYTPDGTHWAQFGTLNTSTFVWTPFSNGNALALGVTLQATPTNPTGTTSTAGAFMGFGGTCKFTPSFSGRVRITIEGRGKNNTSGDGWFVMLYYGTGTAPGNGNTTLSSGTNVGAQGVGADSGGTSGFPYHIEAIVTGLTVGTAYWFDDVLAANTGGTASVVGNACDAMEF